MKIDFDAQDILDSLKRNRNYERLSDECSLIFTGGILAEKGLVGKTFCHTMPNWKKYLKNEIEIGIRLKELGFSVPDRNSVSLLFDDKLAKELQCYDLEYASKIFGFAYVFGQEDFPREVTTIDGSFGIVVMEDIGNYFTDHEIFMSEKEFEVARNELFYLTRRAVSLGFVPEDTSALSQSVYDPKEKKIWLIDFSEWRRLKSDRDRFRRLKVLDMQRDKLLLPPEKRMFFTYDGVNYIPGLNDAPNFIN